MTKEVSTELISSGSAELRSDYKVPARWRIEIRSDAGRECLFKAAFAIQNESNELKLIESTTPFDLEFSTWKLTAFFEAESGDSLRVAGFSDAQGDFQEVCGFGGSIGKIVFDPCGLDGRVLCGAGTTF